ncbi:MAG: hypothetical protein IPM35_29865 [Myxococcales bacterium]|nr:hypothetical protein [Myxococcales bacterium]
MTAAYREPPAPLPPFRVVHGPFTLGLGRVLAGAGFTLVAALLLGLGLRSQELSCGAAPDSWCVISEGTFTRRPVARFPRRELAGASVETRWGGKSGKTEYGRPVLDVGGRAYRMHEVDADAARKAASEIERARTLGAGVDLTLRQSLWLPALGLVMLGAGIAALWSALRGMGRLVVDVDPARRRLTVRRRVLGLPGRGVTSMLGDVRDVIVEQRDEEDHWKKKSGTPRPVGRLIVLFRDGQRLELSKQSFPGRTVHLRAAAALRRGFGLVPSTLEDELAALERVRERPTWAANLGTFALIWMGAPAGLLLGMAAYGAGGLAVGAFRMQDPLSPYALIIGGGLGAIAGAALLIRLARPRPPA